MSKRADFCLWCSDRVRPDTGSIISLLLENSMLYISVSSSRKAEVWLKKYSKLVTPLTAVVAIPDVNVPPSILTSTGWAAKVDVLRGFSSKWSRTAVRLTLLELFSCTSIPYNDVTNASGDRL